MTLLRLLMGIGNGRRAGYGGMLLVMLAFSGLLTPLSRGTRQDVQPPPEPPPGR